MPKNNDVVAWFGHTYEGQEVAIFPELKKGDPRISKLVECCRFPVVSAQTSHGLAVMRKNVKDEGLSHKELYYETGECLDLTGKKWLNIPVKVRPINS